jgi:hypothetical protein
LCITTMWSDINFVHEWDKNWLVTDANFKDMNIWKSVQYNCEDAVLKFWQYIDFVYDLAINSFNVVQITFSLFKCELFIEYINLIINLIINYCNNSI